MSDINSPNQIINIHIHLKPDNSQHMESAPWRNGCDIYPSGLMKLHKEVSFSLPYEYYLRLNYLCCLSRMQDFSYKRPTISTLIRNAVEIYTTEKLRDLGYIIE